MKIAATSVLCLLGLLLVQPIPAAYAAELFETDERLSIRIAAPFSEVTRSRGDEREYFPASLAYPGADGSEVQLELQIRTRGNSRSRDDTCDFPPLRLNFRRNQLQGTLFEGENILKLVTHCQRRGSYEDYLLLEYLNYRVLNVLTANSFRVRLLAVSYVDSGTGRVIEKPGFVIEDTGNLAERLGYRHLVTDKVERARYDGQALNLIELFQFMIGNTDWSVLSAAAGEDCCHNIEPLVTPGDQLIPIPYDFDATGIVDVPYAAPDESLGLRSVTQRLYRGFCRSDDVLEANLAIFRQREADIRVLYGTQAGLTDRSRARALAYLDGFFAIINDSRRLQREIKNACRE